MAATVRMMSEAEAGAWAAERGRRVARHQSRVWEQVRPGFYQPVHVLGPLAQSELSRPAIACWGYRAVVPPGSETETRLVVYLIDDLAGYDEGVLTSKRRGTLRRAQRSALRLVPLENDSLLQRDGYEVCLSAYDRFGFGTKPTPEQYAQRLTDQHVGDRSCGVAAVLDDRLVGYILAHVIEGTSYGEDFHVHTDALRTNASTALLYEMLQLLRQSRVVTRVFNGVVCREDEGLDTFKTSMGFVHTAFPTRVHLWPGAGPLLRRCRPNRYERLTGKLDRAKHAISALEGIGSPTYSCDTDGHDGGHISKRD
jgi:hypothetical protein